MKKNIIFLCIFGFFILLIFFIRNIWIPTDVQKKSVRKNELLNKQQYILCKNARVTGFDWLVIQNEYGENEYKFCNITGKDPFMEHNFNYEFIIADNTYIFYFDNVEFVVSEATGKEERLYHVTEWDILYPVKRDGILGFLNSKKYIRFNDETYRET